MQNNGGLLLESFELSSAWEMMFLLMDEEPEWVAAKLQQHERLVYWSAAQGKAFEKKENRRMFCFLMIRHSFKSDVLAEQLYGHMEKEARIQSELAFISNPNLGGQFITFNRLFQKYLYLEIVETPSSPSAE